MDSNLPHSNCCSPDWICFERYSYCLFSIFVGQVRWVQTLIKIRAAEEARGPNRVPKIYDTGSDIAGSVDNRDVSIIYVGRQSTRPHHTH